MNDKRITVTTRIATDGKYCDEDCLHLRPVFLDYCWLFEDDVPACLGGGPLRCESCLEAERGVTAVKSESMTTIAWAELLGFLNSLNIQYVKDRIMCSESTVEKLSAMIWLRKYDALREAAERKVKETKL